MKRNKAKEKAKRYAPQETGSWSGIRPTIFNESKYDKKKDRRERKEMCRNNEDV